MAMGESGEEALSDKWRASPTRKLWRRCVMPIVLFALLGLVAFSITEGVLKINHGNAVAESSAIESTQSVMSASAAAVYQSSLESIESISSTAFLSSLYSMESVSSASGTSCLTLWSLYVALNRHTQVMATATWDKTPSATASGTATPTTAASAAQIDAESIALTSQATAMSASVTQSS